MNLLNEIRKTYQNKKSFGNQYIFELLEIMSLAQFRYKNMMQNIQNNKSRNYINR